MAGPVRLTAERPVAKHHKGQQGRVNGTPQVAVALHFAHYNFVRQHRTTRVSPAMAAGVSDRVWTLEELVEQTSKC